MSRDEFYRIFEDVRDPAMAWNSKVVQEGMHAEAVRWLDNVKNWSTWLTLTFHEGPAEKLARQMLKPGRTWSQKALGLQVTEEFAEKLFQRLIFELNRDAFGKHYTRKVRHSYFSYVYGFEWQTRGMLHIHAVFDRPINCSLARDLWYRWAGISRFEPLKDKKRAVSYALKDIKRGADLRVPYLAKTEPVPSVLPAWWS